MASSTSKTSLSCPDFFAWYTTPCSVWMFVFITTDHQLRARAKARVRWNASKSRLRVVQTYGQFISSIELTWRRCEGEHYGSGRRVNHIKSAVILIVTRYTHLTIDYVIGRLAVECGLYTKLESQDWQLESWWCRQNNKSPQLCCGSSTKSNIQTSPSISIFIYPVIYENSFLSFSLFYYTIPANRGRDLLRFTIIMPAKDWSLKTKDRRRKTDDWRLSTKN